MHPMPTDSTTRFSNRVADYVKSRPSYPPAVIDVLRERIGFDATKIVADIGAGTGISSALFLAAGNRVLAVEPNAPMRAAAVAALGGDPNFAAIDGTAEATTLPAASVDLIIAAQAFHWFNRPKFAAECRRIGRPGAHLLLLWNERLAVGSPFLVEYEQLLKDISADYSRVDHRNLTDAQIAEVFAAPPQLIDLPNEQTFDFEGLSARALSSSYFPPADDPRHTSAMAKLREVFDRTNTHGTVTMRYTTQLHLGPVHRRG